MVTQALGPDGSVAVTLDEAQAQAWVAALNDLRLYLSAGDHPDTHTLVEWLAFNQDSLLTAMMGTVGE